MGFFKFQSGDSRKISRAIFRNIPGVISQLVSIGMIFFSFTVFMGTLASGQNNSFDSCQKTCVLDAECGVGGHCRSGICSRKNTFCANELWSTNSRGEMENCQNYKCSESSGLCLTNAQQADDCTFGYVKDTFHQCVAQVQCNGNDPACQQLLDKWKSARAQYELTVPPPQLENFSCRSCQQHANCLAGEMCWKGQCQAEGSFCSGHPQQGFASVLVQNKMETQKSCGLYACSFPSGVCKNQCLIDSDCSQGSHCQQRACQ